MLVLLTVVLVIVALCGLDQPSMVVLSAVSPLVSALRSWLAHTLCYEQVLCPRLLLPYHLRVVN